MQVQYLNISELELNSNNPRIVKDEKFRKLVQSIKEFPQMLEIRPIVVNKEMVVLGGNMRLRACKDAGLNKVPVIIADDLTEEQQKEFIIKDNVAIGQWDWEMLANEWDMDLLEDWGMDILELEKLNKKIDEAEDGEEIEIPQSVQLEPPKEFLIIMAEPNSVDWEDLKQTLQLQMVRRGGYKKGSQFDTTSLERVLDWQEFKRRINANSGTK